jgi:hypothetical protein
MLNRPRSIAIGFLLLSAIYCPPGQTQVGGPKISSIKLENFGWQALPERQIHEWHSAPGSLVSIDSRGRVLVSFATRDNLSLATRKNPGLAFHILRFGADGNVDMSLTLPTNDYFLNGIYLAANGQILARANGMLYLYQEGSENDSTAWRSLASCPEDCRISRSFGRRTLIVRTSAKPFSLENLTYTVFDLSSTPPQIRQTCSQMADYGERITDKFEYQYRVEAHTPHTRRFHFCDRDHAEELPLGWEALVVPIDDENFFSVGAEVKGSEGQVKLLGPDGQTKFLAKLPKHDTPLGYFGGAWATSEKGGDRIAFMVSTFRGGSHFFDIAAKLTACRVVVYANDGQQIASIPVSTKYQSDFDFALSPDGHRLAILESGLLTIADLK